MSGTFFPLDTCTSYFGQGQVLPSESQVTIVTQTKSYSYAAIFFRDRALDTSAFNGQPVVIEIEAAAERGRFIISASKEDGITIQDEVSFDAEEGITKKTLFISDIDEIEALILRNGNCEGKSAIASVSAITVRSAVTAEERFYEQTLFAFYDLKRYPIGFDIITYLTAAEMERAKRKLKSIHVIVIPDDKDDAVYLPTDYDAAIDRQSRLWRLDNIVIASFSLFPTISGHTIASSREQGYSWKCGAKHIFPRLSEPVAEAPIHLAYQAVNDRFNHDHDHIGFRALEQGRRYVGQWLENFAPGKRVVTLTMRQSPFGQVRNSNLLEWRKFADGLDSDKYAIVVVPDTDMAFEAIPPELCGLEVRPEFAFHLGLRMALYELAWLNLGSMGGPMVLCTLHAQCRYIVFRILSGDNQLANEAHCLKLHYVIGETPSYAQQGQKWVWKDDVCETIAEEFSAMVPLLEKLDQ